MGETPTQLPFEFVSGIDIIFELVAHPQQHGSNHCYSRFESRLERVGAFSNDLSKNNNNNNNKYLYSCSLYPCNMIAFPLCAHQYKQPTSIFPPAQSIGIGSFKCTHRQSAAAFGISSSRHASALQALYCVAKLLTGEANNQSPGKGQLCSGHQRCLSESHMLELSSPSHPPSIVNLRQH